MKSTGDWLQRHFCFCFSCNFFFLPISNTHLFVFSWVSKESHICLDYQECATGRRTIWGGTGPTTDTLFGGVVNNPRHTARSWRHAVRPLTNWCQNNIMKWLPFAEHWEHSVTSWTVKTALQLNQEHESVREWTNFVPFFDNTQWLQLRINNIMSFCLWWCQLS